MKQSLHRLMAIRIAINSVGRVATDFHLGYSGMYHGSFDWDDARLFLAVAREGSLRGAGRSWVSASQPLAADWPVLRRRQRRSPVRPHA